jgi:hypothetical protein
MTGLVQPHAGTRLQLAMPRRSLEVLFRRLPASAPARGRPARGVPQSARCAIARRRENRRGSPRLFAHEDRRACRRPARRGRHPRTTAPKKGPKTAFCCPAGSLAGRAGSGCKPPKLLRIGGGRPPPPGRRRARGETAPRRPRRARARPRRAADAPAALPGPLGTAAGGPGGAPRACAAPSAPQRRSPRAGPGAGAAAP